jgi:hypothetical protein
VGSLAQQGIVRQRTAASRHAVITLNGGQASLTTSGLSVGRHKISTSYSGDSHFNPNKARPFIQKVVP